MHSLIIKNAETTSTYMSLAARSPLPKVHIRRATKAFYCVKRILLVKHRSGVSRFASFPYNFASTLWLRRALQSKNIQLPCSPNFYVIYSSSRM
jgi:hypothetical protein